MSETTVIDWLLDSDPSIRWQVMRDLLGAPADEVATERARIAREGYGAEILAHQDADGRWAGGTFFPRGVGTFDTLNVLYLLGSPAPSPVRRRDSAVTLARVRLSVLLELRPGARPRLLDRRGRCLTGG
jgi:hypothetical protein